MNQKNSSLPLEGKNIGLEPSLLSRFDLIFELEDRHDLEYLEAVADHILNLDATTKPAWSIDRIQSHVLVARDLEVTVTPAAFEILKRYFSFYRNRDDVDKSRTTMRLWNSLVRLTKCHAKLMLRRTADIIDAVTVVMLFESSWSFGCLSLTKRLDVMQKLEPIGPSNLYLADVLEKLDLEELLEYGKAPPKMKATQQQSSPNKPIEFDDLEAIFGKAETQTESSRYRSSMTSQQPQKSSATAGNKAQPIISDPFDGFKAPKLLTAERSQQKVDAKIDDDFLDDVDYDIFDNQDKLLSTSTQMPTQEKRQVPDPLASGLKRLAASLATSGAGKQMTPKDQPKTSIFDKLKKFQCNDAASPEDQSSYQPPMTQPAQNTTLTEDEQKFLDEIDNMDVWE